MGIAEKMIEYRAKHNISQAEFAKRCSLSVQTVNSIENGHQEPTKLTKTKIELIVKEDVKC